MPANEPPPPPQEGSGSLKPPPPTDQSGETPAKDPLRGSRASGFWAAIVALGVVLVLLVIFIVQNTQPVDVEFLGLDVEAPLAAALLVAAAGGILLAAIGGTLRIWQLRRRVRRTP